MALEKFLKRAQSSPLYFFSTVEKGGFSISEIICSPIAHIQLGDLIE